MNPESDHSEQRELHDAIQRDLQRRDRREKGHASFWRSLGILGMIGWPIALTSVGGALLGRLIDRHYETGVRFTLMLLTVGVAMGGLIAWRAMLAHRNEHHDHSAH